MIRRSAADVEFGSVVHVACARDDNLVSGLEAFQYLDLAHGGRAQLDWRQDGAVAVHDVNGARSGGDVCAPLELSRPRALLNDDPHRAALALAEPGRLLVRELHAAGHLAGAHLRRDCGDESLVFPAVERDLRLHAGLDVARVDVGDLKLDLKSRQVDDRQEWRIFGNTRFLRRGEVRDDAVDRRADRELVDAAFQVCDDVTLALALEPLGLQVEVEALLLEACGFARVLVGELCGFPLILSATEIPLGDCALVPGPLRALELALRGADLHVREVCLLFGAQFLAPDFDALPAKRRVEALERRTLALVFVFESRAREGREQLTFLDAVARAHVIADVAG